MRLYLRFYVIKEKVTLQLNYRKNNVPLGTENFGTFLN